MVFTWRDLPPTPGQIIAITRMCMALGIRPPLEDLPRNRMEARNLRYELRGKLRAKKSRRARETSAERVRRLEQEGREIARKLGNGVGYYGPWLPDGPEGEFYGHLFQDDAVTESSFVAKNYEQAKGALIEMRKKFGAEPPVFLEG